MTGAELNALALAAFIEAVQEHAKRTLTAADPTEEQVEAQGRWLLALWHAECYRDSCDIRDMASIFLEGIPPVGTVQAECASLMGEDEDDDQTNEVLDYLAGL